jgi:cyanate permease
MKTMAQVKDHQMAMDAACVIMALIGGFLAGAVDFNNDEPQAAVLVIVFFAGLLGFAQPRKAWRWAIIVGLGVPIVYLIATAFGSRPKSLPEPGWYASLIALIPAFFSTDCGVLLRKALPAK